MEKYNYRSNILKQLEKRNTRENSFKEIIKYSNKLLESVDFLQKASIPKCLQTVLSEEMASDDFKYKLMYENSRKELSECLAKTSSLAEQVIKLKDTLEERNLLIVNQKTELEKIFSSLRSEHELNVTLKEELVNLKKMLQDKADEFDALNITYSSVDNRKNDLEIENRKLQEQLLRFKELERKSTSSESFESVFSLNTSTGSGKSLPKMDPFPEANLVATKLNFDASHFCPDVVLPTKVKFEFEAHNSEVNAILWFPDSSFLFTAGADRRVKLWEMSDSDVKLLKSVCDCNMAVMSLDMDSDASLLVCASLDFASRIWTTSDFTLRHTLTGHSGRVTSAKFLKDSQKVVSGSADQSLKLWDFRRRVCTATYVSSSPVSDVISKDSNLIISGHSDNKIRSWDMRTKTEISSFLCSGMTTSLDSLRNKNQILVSEQGSNSLKLFDIRTGKESLAMTAKDFVVGCNWTRAKFSPDGKYCCCGSKNGSVFVWSTANGALVRELKSHKANVISCSWSICGSYLATCDSGRKCILWSK